MHFAVAADWWVPNALSMPVRPAAGSNALQNPPQFSWPLRSGKGGYEIQIAGPGGVDSYRSGLNWLHLKSLLATGKYRWRVRGLDDAGSAATEWSDERHFSIVSGQDQFIVPDPEGLWAKAAQTGRPRGMPHGEELTNLKNVLSNERAKDFSGLKVRLQKMIGAVVPSEPSQSFNTMDAGVAKARAMGEVRNVLQTEEDTIFGLGLLWYIDGNRIWLEEARRRVLSLARWDPNGTTGLESHNQATRTIMLTLVFAYDCFYDHWSANEKQLLLNSIRKRFSALQMVIVGNSSLANNPHNPWASYTLGYLVAAAPLLSGDLPEARAWFVADFNLYVATFPAWSGDDGGYANGTAYGVWDVPESIKLWDVLRWSTGFDMYRKPAIRNFGRFMTYFLPPGAPEGVFGDGAEVKMASSIARYGKAFAGRAQSPLVNWYAGQLFGEDRSAFSMLTNPSQGVGAPFFPLDTPSSAFFSSVGWAAMHSNLVDRSRLSVYFKSSPYGSLNHSHADQNSFIVHARGRVIAMDSGIYDYYNSPHWREWYKQTRAHNAITYDGGHGQGLGEAGTGSKELNGYVEKFSTNADYDLVVGDATRAYQGELTKAKRWVALLRPNTIVVIDALGSVTPKRWEWNYHTTTKPRFLDGVLATNDEGVLSCVRVSSQQAFNYHLSEGYTPPPESTAPVSGHFLNRFAYTAPAPNGVFVAVITVDCAGPPPVVSWAGGKAEIRVDGKQLFFSGNDVSIRQP
jgi:hypothetical protein